MKTFIVLSVTHDKPLPDLPELVAGRAWTIDGVTDAKVMPTRWHDPLPLESELSPTGRIREIHKPPYQSYPNVAAHLSKQREGHQPDEISPRWTEVL